MVSSSNPHPHPKKKNLMKNSDSSSGSRTGSSFKPVSGFDSKDQTQFQFSSGYQNQGFLPTKPGNHPTPISAT